MLDAYGIHFHHDDAPVPTDGYIDGWAVVPIRRTRGEGCPIDGVLRIDAESAVLRFREGWLEVRGAAQPASVRLHADLTDEALSHPFLALPAALLNHWWGHAVLHAGAILGRAAVAVLADKGMGKSTTMAAAARAGLEVLTDDLLVLRGGEALRGPRSVDLRPDAAEVFDSRPLGLIGGRERFRVDLPPSRPSAELRAVVQLAWGERTELTPLGIGDRLDPLLAANALGPRTVRHERILELLDRPSYRLTRPRSLDGVDGVVDILHELADAA